MIAPLLAEESQSVSAEFWTDNLFMPVRRHADNLPVLSHDLAQGHQPVGEDLRLL